MVPSQKGGDSMGIRERNPVVSTAIPARDSVERQARTSKNTRHKETKTQTRGKPEACFSKHKGLSYRAIIGND